jgi:Ca2+-binding RTX toxin-like protein
MTVVFTAFQAVNLSPGIITALINFFESSPHVLVSNSTEIKETNGPITVDIHGSGLSQVGGVPLGGTINTAEVDYLTPGYRFTGLSVSVSQLASDVLANQFLAAASLFLPGGNIIRGSTGNDHLADLNGHDIITGGPGNDSMSGGYGHDRFVFKTGFGHDKMIAFIAGNGPSHDTIDLHGVGGLATFHQVQTHEAIVAGHLVIHDNAGDTITFANLSTKAALTSADVIFI